MRFSMVLFVLLSAFLSVVSSQAAYSLPQSFKIPRVPNHRFGGRNGPRALAKAFRKYGISVHPSLDVVPGVVDAAPSVRRSQNVGALAHASPSDTVKTASVAAVSDFDDTEYLSPITIGGQKVNLAFDTGSADLWVFSSRLGTAAQAEHVVYDPDASTTFSPLEDSRFSIAYGDGSGASGIVGTDMVDVGGVVIEQQAIEVATTVSSQFIEDQHSSGILGLGLSKLNSIRPRRQRTFLENIMTKLSEPVFTADLRRNTLGAFEFGKIDNSRFAGDLTWIPVNSTRGYWQFSSEAFAVGNGSYQLSTSGAQAIVDTGTTLILADPTIVQGFYHGIPDARLDEEAGGFTFPCSTVLPDLHLDVGGMYMARIMGADLNHADLGDGSCYGGLQATSHKGLGVYGDIFFKSQFVAFNGGNMSIGIAPHI